jgi:hypothetical protein
MIGVKDFENRRFGRRFFRIKSMPKMQFQGRVIPEIADVSAPPFGSIWKHGPTGIEAHFQFRIERSEVFVDCDSNKFGTPDEKNILTRGVYDFARTIVDLIAFKNGERLYLILDKLDFEGRIRTIRTTDPRLSAISTAVKNDNDFNLLVRLAANNMTVFMALRHLNEAMEPRGAAVRAAQAIDGLRSLFVPAKAKDGAGWPPLRAALNISEEYLKVITDQSFDPRHGNYAPLDGINKTDVVFRAWEVMNRFLEYKKRNDTNLPLSEFPLLTSAPAP